MTPQEKFKQTIIAKYGSWEKYVEQRYHDPTKAEQRREQASKAGKASTHRPFKDKELASLAGKKSKRPRENAAM